MITNPAARTILCFGDSNTYGLPSDDENYVRLAPDVRWTGILQRMLGDGYDVIEEGLSGRTTDVEYADRPGCNGRPYFGPCLRSHHPLDVIVIMLGTNDLKIQFERSPSAIAHALNGYLDDVADNVTTRTGATPPVILVSPIHIDDSGPDFFADGEDANFDATATGRSRALAAGIHQVASARGALFLDAATVARPGADGIHFTADSHEPLARLVAEAISEAITE